MLMEDAPNWKYQYINQGIEEGRGLLLLDLLEDRFGSLPDSVTSYIKNFSDYDGLVEFALFATHAESLQAVIDQININNTLP